MADSTLSVVNPPLPADVIAERSTVAATVLSFTITNESEKVRLGQLVLAIKAMRKRITEHYRPIKQALDSAKKTVLKQEAADLGPVEEAERIGSAKIIAWDAEQERLRREEIQRREEEARRIAEEEKQRQIEEMRKQAAAAKRQGDDDIAAALRAQANAIKAVAVAPVYDMPPEPQKVQGLSTRKTWEAQVLDKLTVVRAVAAGQLPLDLVDINASQLRTRATTLREHFDALTPGCHAEEKPSLAGRTS